MKADPTTHIREVCVRKYDDPKSKYWMYKEVFLQNESIYHLAGQKPECRKTAAGHPPRLPGCLHTLEA